MTDGVETILAAVRERGVNGDYRDLGDIRTAKQGNLLIFNYTNRAQYAKRWNAVERVARGLIVNAATATVVARPFDKFFGLNERPETRLEALPPGDLTATVKADGSLGILYWTEEGMPAIATRGSFTSEQALWATRHLRSVAAPGLWRIPRVTLLFEIIYPENRIVLDYQGWSGLMLIGARWLDGRACSYEDLVWLGEQTGFPVIERVQVSSLGDLLPLAATSTGIEGWVVQFGATGLRVKIKCDEYLRLHRVIFGCTPERIREALLAGWTDFAENIPEELRPGVEAQAQQMMQTVEEGERVIGAVFGVLRDLGLTQDRKAFARHVINQYPDIRANLFALLDGRPIRDTLLRNLDLSAYEQFTLPETTI